MKKRAYQHEYRLEHPRTAADSAKHAAEEKHRRQERRESAEALEIEVVHLRHQVAHLQHLLNVADHNQWETQQHMDWLSEQLEEHQEAVQRFQQHLAQDCTTSEQRWAQWEESPFIATLKTNQARCKEAIYYPWPEFLERCTELCPLIQNTSYYGYEEENKEIFWNVGPAERTSIHPPELLLFVTFFWCRTGLGEGLISAVLPPVHQRDVLHFVLTTLLACGPVLKQEIGWPDQAEQKRIQEEMSDMVDDHFAGAYTVVDGTETEVTRGAAVAKEGEDIAPEREQHSVKKRHCICWTIIVLLTGVIIHYTTATWKHADQTVWNEDNLRDRYLHKPWFGVLVDGGYTPNLKDLFKHHREQIIAGYKPKPRPPKEKGVPKAKRQKLSAADQRHNKALSQSRVVVENVYGRAKHWQVLRRLPVKGSNVYKAAIMNLVLDFLLPLINRTLRTSPQRKAGWVHPNKRQD